MRKILSSSLLSRVVDHAYLEGYNGASDFPEVYPVADEYYINSIGSDEICQAIGVEEHLWEEICNLWCTSYKLGHSDWFRYPHGPKNN